MSAMVIPYSAHPEDEQLSLKIECLDCLSEWGWAFDEAGVYTMLRKIADEHNEEFHK